MIRLQLPAGPAERPLPFFLAMEEWAAVSLPPADYFFCWHVAPTVIHGRNQDPQAEIDLPYCQAHGIRVVRRKSGGGCVYADHGNLMMSYITPSADVVPTFARYLRMVAAMLRGAGIDAHPNDHNDVLVGQRKVSGNAYYRMPTRSIVHGTLLYAPDMRHMTHALTPSRAKLESNKVTSVAARIISVSELTDRFADIDALAAYVEGALTDTTLTLTPAQVAEIEDLCRRDYPDPYTQQPI